MFPVSPPVATVLVGLVLCLTSLLLLAGRKRTEQRLRSERIAAMQRKIEAALGDDQSSASESFGASLRAASLTTGLQRPRLETLAKIDKQPPDKYRILSNLAAQGMDVEEIAAVLGISRVEAGQLISLSTMAKIGR